MDSVKSTAPSVLYITPHESKFAQMESFLLIQQEKCIHYKSFLQSQDNTTLAGRFDTLLKLTKNDLEIVRSAWRDSGQLPKYSFELIKLTCIPTNVDVKDKEMLVTVKLDNLPVAESSLIYVTAEFEFPLAGKEESISESVRRWWNNCKIEPKKLFCCCSNGESRQLDIMYSTDFKPFYDPENKQIHFNRAASFFVDKGKSRTLKRKYKPVKLTFYEKTSLLSRDNKIGTVQVRIDAINDISTIVSRAPVMNGHRQTEATAEIIIRIREPLVDKSLKSHKEKMLVLT